MGGFFAHLGRSETHSMHALPHCRNVLPSACMLMALLVLFPALAGCGTSRPPAVDRTPFEAAIAQYLERNNMAMALKEIKEGPTIQDNTATLTASLVHAQMGGPAVQWQFTFEKDAKGNWQATGHKP